MKTYPATGANDEASNLAPVSMPRPQSARPPLQTVVLLARAAERERLLAIASVVLRSPDYEVFRAAVVEADR